MQKPLNINNIINNVTYSQCECLQSIVEFSPAGDGYDDGYRFQSLLETIAYQKVVQLMPGEYSWQTVCNVPSGTTILGGPGVRIVSTIEETVDGYGSPEQAVFYAAPVAPTVLTTLTAPTTLGSTNINVTSSSGFNINQEVALINDNHCAMYIITNISSNTITFDREILHEFPISGTLFVDRTAPKDIRLIGNGMTITGTGDAFIEWSSAWKCHVEGINVVPDEGYFQYVIVNFDVGSRECTFKNSFLNGGGVTDSCWHFESAENCRAERIRSRGATNQAIFLTSGYGCLIDSCSAEDSNEGCILNSAQGLNGVKAFTLINCTFTGNTGTGLDILNGSNYISVIGCDARYNNGTGMAVNDNSSHVTFISCRSSNNGAGFYVVEDCGDVQFIGCFADNNIGFGIQGEGEFSVTNFSSHNSLAGGIRVGSGGRASVTQSNISASHDSSTAAWPAFTIQSTDISALRVLDTIVTMSGSGTKAVFSSQASGVTYAQNLLSVGGTYGWVASSGFFKRGPQVNLSSCTTPYLGGQLSFGTLTLNGTTNVDHPFTVTVASDRPRSRRTSLAGTVGHFICVPVAGVGIRISGQAGDTSTVEVDLI